MKSGTQQLILLFLVILASGCTGVKYLEDGEKLLYKQSIEGVEKANKDKLLQEITVNPNTRIPLLGPIGAAIYESGEDNFDTAAIENKRREFIERIDGRIAEKEAKGKKTKHLESKKRRKLDRFQNKLKNGNFRMRTGSPLAIYDTYETETSRSRMESYLKDHGFRKAEVKVEIKEKGRKVNQIFRVNEGPRSYIDSLRLRTGDTAISNLINSTKSKSALIEGEPYNKEDIDLERQRIESLLRDNGYYNFNKRFIEFEVFYAPDTNNLWISTIVNKPSDRPSHQIYRMDSIIFNTHGLEIATDTLAYRDITYTFGSFNYSPKVLDTRLIFRPGELYDYTDVINTQRQLLAIDIFRYVNINFDTTSLANRLVTHIYTAPLKKYQITQELGVNVTQGYPGPFYNLSLKNRNTFGGLEILELNGFVGSEGIAQATSEKSGPYKSLQYGGNLSVTLPRFLTPFPSRKLNLSTFNPKTSISVGYSFNDRPEYQRESTNGTFSYNWQNLKGNKNYILNLFDGNLIKSVVSPEFDQLLTQLANQGNTLNLAFKPSFVSSTSFSATLNHNYANIETPSSFLRYFAEAGGSIYNVIGTGLLRNNDLEYYQFLKVQADYRRYYPISLDKSITLRVNSGIAKPYSPNKTLPYEKYFFSGGSNSNRAWTPRRLGPGSSFPYLLDENGNNVRDEEGELVPDRSKNSYRFEQPGEILLELNAEYRANIAGFFDWAFFIDAGNVWRMSELKPTDPDAPIIVSPGADFKFNRFYKEIAVGAGLGLRLDFSFLVFRLDVGHKLRDPRLPLGHRWLAPFAGSGNQTVWNIAVGYPF